MEFIFNTVFYFYWALISLGFITVSVTILLAKNTKIRNSVSLELGYKGEKTFFPAITFLFLLFYGIQFEYIELYQVHRIVSAYVILSVITSAMCFLLYKTRIGFILILQGSMYYWILINVFNGEGLWFF